MWPDGNARFTQAFSAGVIHLLECITLDYTGSALIPVNKLIEVKFRQKGIKKRALTPASV